MDGNFVRSDKKYFKKISFIAVCVYIFLLSVSLGAFFKGSPVAYAGGTGTVVMEVSSARVLGGINIHQRLPMASTTKVVTAIVAIESGKIDDVVTIPKAAVGIEGSSIYLTENEKLTVRELLYGLMLRSGNDAATAIAIYIGGNVEGFAKMMNDKAAALDLKNSNFVNPHGLHDSKHYTSAYDLCVMTCYAMRNPVFAEIAGTKNINISAPEGGKRYLVNKNKFLYNYPGATGIKTGYTKVAGRCLVSGSRRDGMELAAVVLNCGDMYGESGRLMDRAYSQYEMTHILSKDGFSAEAQVNEGKQKTVALKPERDIFYPLKKDGSEQVKIETVNINEMPAPVRKSEKNGEIKITMGERLLFSENLYTMNDVEKLTLKDKMREYFRKKGLINAY